MSAAARDSRSASKVSSSLGPGVGAGSGPVYFGAGGGTMPRVGSGNPGGGGLTRSSAYSHPREPKGCISCPIPPSGGRATGPDPEAAVGQ